ncbi:TetR/AcrR family transcriptional regulator [Streptomyces zhihengii]|uniref:TetR/AcrR family transcriptional regulator n=1 Tax=Streptomyces zhihengii TaxID=1818004 RepID=UPI0036BBE9C7
MPAAREALLDAAAAALRARPWSAVRMVEVAASAGVSRQTLYNEFGGKDGLAGALVRREAEGFLRGAGRVVAEAGESGAGEVERCVRLAEWTAGRMAGRPLLRALLTGCWSERLPVPRGRGRSGPGPADAGPPAPGELLGALRVRLGAPERAYELAVRLAVSQVIAPAGEGVSDLVRSALGAEGRGRCPGR